MGGWMVYDVCECISIVLGGTYCTHLVLCCILSNINIVSAASLISVEYYSTFYNLGASTVPSTQGRLNSKLTRRGRWKVHGRKLQLLRFAPKGILVRLLLVNS